jgi:uncharacterized membrane protein
MMGDATPAKLRQLAADLGLDEAGYSRALELAGAAPDRAFWLKAINTFLMALGTLLICAGIAAFFAWNWAELQQMAKFALIEGGIALGAIIAWRMKLDSTAGRAALLAAGFLVGVLLAVYGQVYQTGADPYGLFLGWGMLILPWVLIGRQAGLWMLLIVLANLSIIMYWTQVLYPPGGLWQLSQLLGPLVWLSTTVMDSRLANVVFALNVSILVAWEILALRGAKWMQARWLPRVIALVCLTIVLIPTLFIAIGASLEANWRWSVTSPILFAASVTACFYYYQKRQPDLLVLTLCMLGSIMVITCLFARGMRGFDDTLLLALIIIGQTAGAAFWLRRISRGWEDATA